MAEAAVALAILALTTVLLAMLTHSEARILRGDYERRNAIMTSQTLEDMVGNIIPIRNYSYFSGVMNDDKWDVTEVPSWSGAASLTEINISVYDKYHRTPFVLNVVRYHPKG